MAVLVSTFRDEMIKDGGESTSDTDVQTLYLAWIQEVVDFIFNFADWGDFLYLSEEITTSNGTAEYSLSASAEDIVSLRHKTDDTPLEFYTKQELERMGLNIEATGTPECFYDAGYDASTEKYKIGFYPIPNATIIYVATERKKSILLAASDNLPLPREFFPALKEGIRMQIYLRDKDYLAADRAERRRDTQLGMLRRKIKNRSDNARMAVADVPKSGGRKWVRLDPAHFSNKW